MDSKTPTRTLVERAKLGNRDAVTSLTERCRDDLDHHVRLRVSAHLRSRVEIEDVVQETFATAFRTLAGFQFAGDGSFLRWLKGIAEHVILRAAEKDRHSKILYVKHDDIPSDDASASKVMMRDERFTRLEEALERLSPEHREVITLARLKGLRIKEIAARMDRSENAISLLLSRALSKLKEAFGDTESFSLPARRLADTGTQDDNEQSHGKPPQE